MRCGDAQFAGVDDLNPSWNGIWDVAITRDRLGWTAEFRIPLLAPRFRPGASATFGFNVRRIIRRKNEEDLWRSYGRAQGLYLSTTKERSSGSADCADLTISSSTRMRLAAWHGGGHVILGSDLTRTTARLPAGHFTAVLSANRIEYDFNTRASLLAFVQYDNESERVDFNVRLHWIPVIGDDCYVVWNSGYTTDHRAPFRFPRARALARPLNGALVVKLVHRLTP